MRYTFFIACALLFITTNLFSQDRFEVLSKKLEILSVDVPKLNDKIEVSVNGITIQEFIQGIANSNNLNLSVDGNLDTKIYNNFTNVTVSEVLIYICRKYDLDIQFIGPIMSLVKFQPSSPPVPKVTSKPVIVSYDKDQKTISIDLSNDSISTVTKAITKATEDNIIYSPDISYKVLNGYVQNMPVANALDKLAFANDLKLTKSEDNVYMFERKDPNVKSNKASDNQDPKFGKLNASNLTGAKIKITDNKITLNSVNSSIRDLVTTVSQQMGISFFLFDDLKGDATFSIENATYDEFLKYLLNGTENTFKREGNLYMIGNRNLEGLRTTKVITLKLRTIDKVIENIPPDLKKGVDIKPFPDLNSLIVSGSEPRINEIEAFIRDIDRVVPVVIMEVFIVDVRDSRTLSTGLEAGLGKNPNKTSGKVFPGIDMSLNSTSLNELISGINGFGFLNLGKVTPNFYFNLKLLEEQGVLKMKSTPKLATLNGHEAKMSIGRTEYYLEIQNNVIGTQNPQNIVSQQYKSVNADLSLSINPYVSGDEQITLDIGVKQSNFTERISPSAPPGTISRDFHSLVRIKNEEMIILGGLEENSTNDSGSGLPVLSRIPVIKWLFSSRNKSKSKNKLTILLKATVIY